LRTAARIAGLRRDQGPPADGRDLLEPVYGWFTEALDTADLKEAKALLDELTCQQSGGLARMAAFWPTRSPTGKVVKVGFGSLADFV
jgi:hypothetical protein